MTLRWHPRATHAPQRGTAVYFVDEAEVTREQVVREFSDAAARAVEAEAALDEFVDETFEIPRAARLPLPARSGPRLDPEATARVGRRLQQEREELVALRRAGLID